MEINYKSIYYPPGGILIWIVIYLELFTFGMALLAMAYYGSLEREMFHESAQLLNKGIATANTVLLLTSGFFVARGVHFFKGKEWDKTNKHFLIAMLFGLGFLGLKLVEYYQKIELGYTMDYNLFFNFYWFLTAFHWLHVLVGIVILFFVRLSVRKKKDQVATDDVEAGAAFWHLCDIIWLLLFPIIYLIF